MPKINSKPVVCICKPEEMVNINFDLYIDPSHVGCVVSGGDSEIEKWAKTNRIEWVCYLPQWNIYKNKNDAKLIRDKNMVDFSDVLIIFWNRENFNALKIIEYAQQIGCPYICHFIKDLD